MPPKGYLKEVRRICTENNVLLIVDEVQSGMGRTGKNFAFQHEGIQPDGLILGKALGGGLLPISLFLGRREMISLMTPGSHGSTFGGNPLACAVAQEAMDLLVEEKLADHSAKMGAHMLERLKNIKSPFIKEVRGMGLWACWLCSAPAKTRRRRNISRPSVFLGSMRETARSMISSGFFSISSS